jgi:glycosyltransferase involved in cell wall biosynthesis
LYLGRLAREKNVAVILKAFARAANAIPAVDLVIAGSGPEREALAALARTLELDGRLEFTGDVARNRAFELVKGASCLVLASDVESHPIVAIEAMAAGKIVIGPRLKGMTEIIEEGANGALYPRGDAGALAALLTRYAGDAGARSALEARVARADYGRYDIRALAGEHLRLWQPAS